MSVVAKKAAKKAAKKVASKAVKKAPTPAKGKAQEVKASPKKSTGLIRANVPVATAAGVADLVPEARRIVEKIKERSGKLSTMVLSYQHGVATQMADLRAKYGEESNAIFRQMAEAISPDGTTKEISAKTMNSWANAAEAFSKQVIDETGAAAEKKGFRLTWTHFVDAAVLTEKARLPHIHRVINEQLSTSSAQLLLTNMSKKNKAKGGKSKPPKVPKDVNALLGKARAIAVQYTNYSGAISSRVQGLTPADFSNAATKNTLASTVKTLTEAQQQIAETLAALSRVQSGSPAAAPAAPEPAATTKPAPAEKPAQPKPSQPKPAAAAAEVDLTVPTTRPKSSPVTPANAKPPAAEPVDEFADNADLVGDAPEATLPAEEAATVSDDFVDGGDVLEDEFAEPSAPFDEFANDTP